MSDAYPVDYDVEYPDRPLNRLTTLLRIFTVIPIGIVLGTVSGEVYALGGGGGYSRGFVVTAGGMLFAGPLLMILFREKYPRWSLTGTRNSCASRGRVGLYVALMDDRYPSTDERDASPTTCAIPTFLPSSTASSRSSSGCSPSPTTSCSRSSSWGRSSP